MQKVTVFFMSLFICIHLSAEVTCDSIELTNDTLTGNTITGDNQETIKTYRNWLGETCIDFGHETKNYYNWKRDISYVGAPIFISSFVIKGSKKSFRSARFSMNANWKTEIDNYTQYSPYVALIGLKAFGVRGRSSWDRMLTSAIMSNIVMAAAVNSMKYTIKERRPDNSSSNSFPSGHTATAFAAATILHKEYGLTRSPWYSVGGYTVAIGTGFMRVLNNRHWISDVMAGAGIGILSTELGYFITDLIYRNKGICSTELTELTDPTRPSFFDIQMGAGIHANKMKAQFANGQSEEFVLGTSTAIGVEGAYFLNKHIGLGAMARITTTPAKGLALTGDDSDPYFIDGSFDLGIYGNLPVGNRFSLGAKVLGGTRISGGFEYADSKITGGQALNFVVGSSATYRYKNNFSWKAFFDFDTSKTTVFTSRFNIFTLGGAFTVNF